MKRIIKLCIGLGICNIFADDLVDITTINPNIRLDIRYATTNNFTHQKVYPSACCYVRKAVAERLDRVQKELESLGYGLLIWDGYRPLSVQRIFWNLVPDERYVMPPEKGSRHNRGAAVDVTLVKLDGTPIQMPTDFDDFSEKAHCNYMDLPQEVINNRQLLTSVMYKYGFTGVDCEWWHFDDTQWQKYPIEDINI
jgi:D-alanyl-D-alanine dipeptidase